MLTRGSFIEKWGKMAHPLPTDHWQTSSRRMENKREGRKTEECMERNKKNKKGS